MHLHHTGYVQWIPTQHIVFLHDMSSCALWEREGLPAYRKKSALCSWRAYREKVHTVMRGSYSHHYRRMVPKLLSVLSFQSNNDQHQPVIEALDLVKQYAGQRRRFYAHADEVPLNGVVPNITTGRKMVLTHFS